MQIDIYEKNFYFSLKLLSRAFFRRIFLIVFHDNCMHIICTTSGKLWKRLPVCEIGTEKKIQLWEQGEREEVFDRKLAPR